MKRFFLVALTLIPLSCSAPEAELEAPAAIESSKEQQPFTRDGAWLSPRAEGKDERRAHVRFAARGASSFELSDRETGAFIAVRSLGGREAEAEIEDDALVYRSAGPGGGDVSMRPRSDGVEDFVDVKAAPERARIDYEVALGEGIRGLRLVESTLEFLDEGGAPRLRVAPPYLLDARGARIEARLDVEGCAYDAEPRGPWGRKTTEPGSRRCTVVVSWSGADVVYPAVVDPLWTTASDMIFQRRYHAATTLTSGQVLLSGGEISPTTAELYDPVTGTFAATASMPSPHLQHTASFLETSNRVLVAGGYPSPVPGVGYTNACALYDASTGVWSPAASLGLARADHNAIVAYRGGKEVVIVMGSAFMFLPNGPSVEIWDPATDTWSTGAAPPKSIPGSRATLLAGGIRILVAGAKTIGYTFPDAFLYDIPSDQWSTLPNMNVPRGDHSLVATPSGKVLVVGPSANAELFDPVQKQWSPLIPLASTHARARLAVLGSGRVLIAGEGTANAEIYDPAQNVSAAVESMKAVRTGATASALDAKRALFAGGSDPIGRSTEIFEIQPLGGSCMHTFGCDSGLFCADGVCCNEPCNGPCDVCSAALGGGADGICTVLPKGSSGQPACPGALACNGTSELCPTSCAADIDCSPAHHCDAGACALDLPTGDACQANNQCLNGHCVDGVCCDGPCNGKCQACVAAKKISGPDGVCGNVLEGTDPHGDCPDDGALSCKRDGVCDGEGACRLYATGTVCKPDTCIENAPVTYACNGVGACLATTGDACGLSLCVGGACNGACVNDADCIESAFCDAGQCSPKAAPGSACSEGSTCLSGFCADGVCCNAACDGQCEACAEPGAEGICVPVSGEPRGNRMACPAADPGAPCTARACDGLAHDHCEGFVSAKTQCAEASCKDGVARLAASCDGAGHCQAQAEEPCFPFACAADKPVCQTSCSSSSDCAAGYSCIAGSCIGGAVCLSENVLHEADGTEKDCSPYVCVAAKCLETCADVSDCSPGYVCDLSQKCVRLDEQAGDGACACSAAGAGETSNGLALASGALFAAAWRRRRRRLAGRQNE